VVVNLLVDRFMKVHTNDDHANFICSQSTENLAAWRHDLAFSDEAKIKPTSGFPSNPVGSSGKDAVFQGPCDHCVWAIR